jgi:hypothetical protein
LKDWHLHEVALVLLSEILFNNKLKTNTMKEILIKISIHLMISGFLTNLGCMITLVGGQAIPLDRFSRKVF